MFCEAVFLSTMGDENYNGHCQPQRQYENSQKSLENKTKKRLVRPEFNFRIN